MKSHVITALAIVAALGRPANAQSEPKLHVSSRWEECSIQLDPSLTQAAWRQFTQEAGLVVAFRPLTDARPMGKGKFELSVLQWKTGIRSADAAWNDTFVHPDSTHWLFEGDGLKFPGLSARVGLSDRTDLGGYFTKSPGANYGFYGAQLQHSFLGDSDWGLAVRSSFVGLFGPEDVDFHQAAAELLVSRTFRLTRSISVSPYAGVSDYIAWSHEKSAVVSLNDEFVPGSQSSIGASVNLYGARLGVEYNAARVSSLSMKMGFGM
jgi:hypothetical protein